MVLSHDHPASQVVHMQTVSYGITPYQVGTTQLTDLIAAASHSSPTTCSEPTLPQPGTPTKTTVYKTNLDMPCGASES